MRKDKLNDIIRNKIAIDITMNPKKTHKEIANFYGVSRQLVTLVAIEYNLQRRVCKNYNGSFTHPNKSRADIAKINEKHSKIDSRFIGVSDNLIMEMLDA